MIVWLKDDATSCRCSIRKVNVFPASRDVPKEHSGVFRMYLIQLGWTKLCEGKVSVEPDVVPALTCEPVCGLIGGDHFLDELLLEFAALRVAGNVARQHPLRVHLLHGLPVEHGCAGGNDFQKVKHQSGAGGTLCQLE